MTVLKLYTGGGVSYSPEYAEGRTESDFVRLVADEGMGITNGTIVTTVVDVPTVFVGEWVDCAAPVEPESATAEEILDILLGGGAK